MASNGKNGTNGNGKKREETAARIIKALKETNGLLTMAASKSGIGYRTVCRYVAEFPSVKEAAREAKEAMLDFAEGKLHQNIKAGDNTAIIFYLKTQGKARGYIEKTEISNPPGESWRVEHDAKGQLLNELARFAAREGARQRVIGKLSNQAAEELIYDWSYRARLKQLPPEWDWYIWLLLSGRGGGKTRTGAELVRTWAKEGYSPIALVGKTKADVRDTMVEVGESSILRVSPPWDMPQYEPSKRRLTWRNGVVGIIYSGDEPDELRGPQHQKAWVDELAKFKKAQESWDNLMFGLRMGKAPQAVVTTTPRPIQIIKDLIRDERTADHPTGRVAVTLGHTLENAKNLAPDFLKYIMRKYEGTRLGRQELAGEILDDNPNALWQRGQIDELRVTNHPALARVVVAIDPEATDTEDSAETGIIVAGIAPYMGSLHGYILADLTLRGSPNQWATAAVTGYYRNMADKIIGEVNNGGDMVGNTVKMIDASVPFKAVHASRGKYTRAEPVSALYEQGRVHHVGFFPDLEDQLCEWVPGDTSPDRLDALVWAITELMLEEQPGEWRRL
jgi:phage terminase large subunit-like protein